mmetsp:Transcript_26949/g.93536  ORF Transcript_26949/g.93536 Transcript_26949/m.93536 type:complete len:552 (-) Transcript_26949:41-1696(-)
MGGICAKVDKPKSKAELPQRFLVLVLSSSVAIGSYYCYDNPSALQKQMRVYMDMESEADKDKYNYYANLLYTVYSVPNVILPFFGGYFADLLGARNMNILFSGLVAAGQLIFAFGASTQSWPIMLVGRTVFGFGGESLSVSLSAIVAEWFKGKELAFALGIQLSIARVGSVVNDNVSPWLASEWAHHDGVPGVPETLFFGTFICAASVICAILIVPLDRRADKILLDAGSKLHGGDEEEMHLKDVREFQRSFWLLTFACVVVYGCVLPFNNVAQSLLVSMFICHGSCCLPADTKAVCAAKNNKAAITAGHVMGIPYIISAVASPLLGGLVDRIGGRARLALGSSVVLIGVHLSLGLAGPDDFGIDYTYVPLIFQGVAYSIFAAALWPSVPYLVKPHQTGSAYGVMTALQNGGLALFPLLVAAINSYYNSWVEVEYMFCLLAGLGAISGLVLNCVDARNNGLLNKSHYGEVEEEMKRPGSPVVDETDGMVKTPELRYKGRQVSMESERKPLLGAGGGAYGADEYPTGFTPQIGGHGRVGRVDEGEGEGGAAV